MTSAGVGTSGPEPNGICSLLVVIVVVVTVIGSGGTSTEPVGARLEVLVAILLGGDTCAGFASGGAAPNETIACAASVSATIDGVVGNAALVDAAISAERETDVANLSIALLFLSRDTHRSTRYLIHQQWLEAILRPRNLMYCSQTGHVREEERAAP